MRRGLFSETTICLYSDDQIVYDLVRGYADQHNLSCYVADCESDLIAIPYYLLILDVNKLQSTVFFDWLAKLEEDNVPVIETVVSHTSPNKASDINFPEKIKFKEHITENDLNSWRETYLKNNSSLTDFNFI